MPVTWTFTYYPCDVFKNLQILWNTKAIKQTLQLKMSICLLFVHSNTVKNSTQKYKIYWQLYVNEAKKVIGHYWILLQNMGYIKELFFNLQFRGQKYRVENWKNTYFSRFFSFWVKNLLKYVYIKIIWHIAQNHTEGF